MKKSKKEKAADKKAEKEASADEKQANKVELAKAKNPTPITYGDSSSLLGSSDSGSDSGGGIPWIWIGIIAVGGFIAFKYFRSR